jgi:hypothetical protein
MSVVECGRCIASTRAGKRCKRKTRRIAEYCHQHLHMLQGLAVKPSKIPGAGLGLFTLARIQKGARIVRYEGEEISRDELDRRYPGDVVAPYALELGNGVIIDATSTQSGVARYANGGDKPGAQCQCNMCMDDHGWLHAECDIPAGMELLWAYGTDYWM